MAKTILIAGAGKSATHVIQFLLDVAAREGWKVIVMDGSEQAIRDKAGNHPALIAAPIDIHDAAARNALVAQADIVVSLMPPALHLLLAQDCLKYGKHLITSSYVSPEIASMDTAVKSAGLMFMCEMGLDPGIDHMSAMKMFADIKARGGKIVSFDSYCGGLVAPESDDNPWHYKFSWNPINIINAGKDGAQYLHEGKEVKIGYKDMFAERAAVPVHGLPDLAYYPNRDSLKYIDTYGLHGIETFMRATLRYPAFCKGWKTLVDIGITDMTQESILTTYRALTESCLQKSGIAQDSIAPDVHSMMAWLGLFSDEAIPSHCKFSGEALLALLLDKWALQPHDRDMVVMKHVAGYTLNSTERHTMTSTLVLKGEDAARSAMSKTVGMPMGILAYKVLQNEIATLPAGVHIPIQPEIYEPVLHELEKHGVVFLEEDV